MLGLRPKTTGLYLERERLIRQLPDSGGYVIWLEAAYGYGKSVFTSQWAGRLESQGWRVIWLSLMGEEARGLVAKGLGLPANAPWSVVLEALWSVPTLLILEDIEGNEKLTPLLKNPSGLVLISSRKPIPEPELPRLLTDGRLIHLRAADLAFTLEEATRLFSDAAQARDAWQRSQGWSLPLHLAALTGEVPERSALLEGMRESLESEVWAEALLLAALTFLPLEQASNHTRRLAEAGFAQTLEPGYRLHPLAAETVLTEYAPEVRAVVKREAGRLSPQLRAEAFERLELWPELSALLEEPTDLPRLNPAGVVRWDAHLNSSGGPGRLLNTGEALCLAGRKAEGVTRLLEVAAHPLASPKQRLSAYSEALWHLAESDPDRAASLIPLGEALFAQVSPSDVAKFVHHCSRLDFITNNFEQGEARIQRALALIPQDAPKLRRSSLLTNLAVMRWYRLGDLEGQQSVLEEMLSWEGLPPLQAGIMHWNLGMSYLMTNQTARALEHLKRTQDFEAVRPVQAIQARAMQLILEQRLAELPAVMARLTLWEQPAAEDRIRAYWALALLQNGQAQAALEPCSPETPYCQMARARALSTLGRTDQALETLRSLTDLEERDVALYWNAAHYQINRDPDALEQLLTLTTSGAKILPHFVALTDIPRHRPELAAHYPLEQVLASGWKQAVQTRLSEIPQLEIEVMGGLRVRRLGEEVSLTQRPKEILLLGLLGEPREAIAEALWGELEPEKMRNNLHFNLNALRKTLEPWGISTYLTEDGLSRVHTDLHDLEAALKASDAEAVLRLYKGDFAPGVDIPSLNETRERLRERSVEQLYRAASATPERREAYLERILELDPLHESAMHSLLELLMRQGRRAAAQQRYQHFERRLRSEYGLEPAHELRRLVA